MLPMIKALYNLIRLLSAALKQLMIPLSFLLILVTSMLPARTYLILPINSAAVPVQEVWSWKRAHNV